MTTQHAPLQADTYEPEWTLGDRLGRALRHADISVGQMADELGVSRATVGRWINDRGPIGKAYLRLWAMTTGVSLDWLESGQRARRDSNPKPSDLESRRLRLVAGGVNSAFTPDRRTGSDRPLLWVVPA